MYERAAYRQQVSVDVFLAYPRSSSIDKIYMLCYFMQPNGIQVYHAKIVQSFNLTLKWDDVMRLKKIHLKRATFHWNGYIVCQLNGCPSKSVHI